MRISRSKTEELLKKYDPTLKLGELIGDGGTSDVYDLPGTEPAQVLKVMDTNCLCDRDSDFPEYIERRRRMRDYFCNEIWAMEQLKDCKYIVPLIKAKEISMEPGGKNTFRAVFFVQMRKLETLSEYLNRTESTEKTMVQLAGDICHALTACREKSILHRDVKPSNIFVAEDKKGSYFVLGDFGVSRRMRQYSGFVSICGTPEFTAPEIINHTYTPTEYMYSSDIYSLGSTLYYEMSGGRYPGLYFKDGKNFIERIPGISEGFSEIILKSVQYFPKNGYRNSEEMYEKIEKLVPEKSRKIISNPHFLGAKQAMLVGDYTLALRYSRDGWRLGEKGCQRLYAYSLYHEYLHNPKYMNNPLVYENVIENLDVLTYEGDSIAQCLRATIHQKNGELQEFLMNIQEAAEDRCTLAQHLYGRILYYGENSLPGIRDRQKGLEMLIESAKENYLPSLRILKRIMDKDPAAVIPAELMPALELYNKKYDKEVKTSIIRCL